MAVNNYNTFAGSLSKFAEFCLAMAGNGGYWSYRGQQHSDGGEGGWSSNEGWMPRGFPLVGAWGNSGSWNGWQSWGSDPCVAPFLGGMPVPQVSVQDAVRQMPRDMVQEVVMQVPVPPVQAVEGATVVPQVQIAAKIDSFEVRVPVPQVSVQEGVS